MWAASKSFLGLRTRAFVLLCWGSALRISEALALDFEQVIEADPKAKKKTDPGFRIRTTAYLRDDQSKGRYGGGAFTIPTNARAALRAYLLEAQQRGWLQVAGPLFIGIKRRGGESGHERLSVRSVQHTWDHLQQRARLSTHYRSHDLRHDAITRFSTAAKGNVYLVQAYGRFRDIRTSSRYVHMNPATLAELSEAAARM